MKHAGSPTMSNRTSVEALVRRDRWLAGGALAMVTALCWAWILPMAIDMYGAMDRSAAWMMENTWDLGYCALLFAMWVVMMAGMMLPSAAPAMLLYGFVVRKNPDVRNATPLIYAFAGGYLLVWVAFSLVATVLQWLFAHLLLLNPMMESGDPVFGGVLLIAAGVYQFTPLKNACLQACRSPAEFLTQRWKNGAAGGFQLGAAYGLFCLGCCWALMLLLFVGGVMNLWWIAALTFFVLLEKLAPFGARGGRLAGIGLGAMGLWSLLRAAG